MSKNKNNQEQNAQNMTYVPPEYQNQEFYAQNNFNYQNAQPYQNGNGAPLPNGPYYQPNPAYYQAPPAELYPQTDRKGRVIKYKKRGGVFPFFMGLLTSLFVLIFGFGVALSYVYYCVKVDDITGTLGLDTSFLPVDTNNKTVQEVVAALIEYKDGYTEMTVSDAKTKLGFDLEEFIEKNIGLTIDGLYDIQIVVSDVNDGNAQSVGDFRLQDIANNLQDFIDGILPELYKKITIGSILDLANVDFSSYDYPLFNDAIFDVTPNPTFTYSGTSYQIDFTKNEVLDINGYSLSSPVLIENNSFNLNGENFVLNQSRTTLSYSGGTIVISYNATLRSLKNLTIDQALNTVLPNYLSGDKLTIGFAQTALGLNIIPDSIEEDANYEEKFGTLLNTSIRDINTQELFDNVTVKSVLELVGIDAIPFDDARYDALLDAFVGKITFEELTQNMQIGAVLDLLDLDLSSFPILTTEEFRTQTIQNAPDYLLERTIGEIIAVPEQIYYYDTFTIGGNEYYVIESTIQTKANMSITSNTFTIGDNNYIIDSTNSNVEQEKFISISDSTFVIDGITYQISQDEILNESGESLSPQVLILNNQFTLDDVIYEIDNENSRLIYYEEVCKIIGNKFTLNDVEYSIIFDEINSQITSLEYLITVCDIDINNNFTISGNSYVLDRANSQILQNDIKVAELFAQSSTVDILLYSIQDLTLEQIIDGTVDGIADGLKDLHLSDMIELPAFLNSLGELSVGEILEDPNSIMTSINTITLGEIAGISASDKLLGGLANLTLEQIISDSTIVLDTIKDVTLADLGIDSTNTLLGGLASLTIGDIMDNPDSIMEQIGNKTLADFCGDTTSGFMQILGDLTINNLMNDADAITNKLETSEVTLAVLLGQTVDEKASSLTKAFLNIQVKDLFGDNFETTLSNSLDSINITDFIGTDNFFINKLVSKADESTPATIGNMATLLNKMTIGDFVTTSNGIINLLSYEDPETSTLYEGANIPLKNFGDALAIFDITSISIGKLIDNGIIKTEDTSYDSLSQKNKELLNNLTLLGIIEAYIQGLIQAQGNS